jgi:ATP-dependent exoDNAse (exonuclease V) beta subunit
VTTDASKKDALPFAIAGGCVSSANYAVVIHDGSEDNEKAKSPIVSASKDDLANRLTEYWAKPYPYATGTLKKTTATIRANAVEVTVARDPEGFLRDGDATEVGNAYHAVMQHIDFAADVDAELTRLKTQGLVSESYLALVDKERIALACKAMHALGGSVKRELAFLTSVKESELYGAGDGRVIVQGIIDALVETEDGAIIVDYKTTDASAEYLRARYTPQLATYCDACTAAGIQVKRKTIWSFVKNAWVDCD